MRRTPSLAQPAGAPALRPNSVSFLVRRRVLSINKNYAQALLKLPLSLVQPARRIMNGKLRSFGLSFQ